MAIFMMVNGQKELKMGKALTMMQLQKQHIKDSGKMGRKMDLDC